MNTNQSRFDFAGFEFVRQADITTHEVEIGRVSVNGEVFIVHLIRKKGLSFTGNFLIAAIFDKDEKKELWKFPKFVSRLGFLAYADEELVIAYVGKGQHGNVEDVVPLSAIIASKPIDLCRKAALKRLAATYLQRHYTLTDNEYRAEEDAKRETREAKEREREEARHLALEAKEREYEARRKVREEARQKIKARPKIEVVAKDFSRKWGYPVVGDEWFSLLDGDHVVLVTSYDDKTRIATGPIEAFKVSKGNGGSPRKLCKVMPVSFPSVLGLYGESPASPPKPIRTIIMKTKEGLFEVMVYKTVNEVRAARAAGLNSGSYVTAEDKKAGDGRYEVYSVRKDGIETVGFAHPLSK